MNILGKAITNDDLDAALKLVQDALGIESGDVAGMFFSARHERWWSGLTYRARTAELGKYIQAEINHAYWDLRAEDVR